MDQNNNQNQNGVNTTTKEDLTKTQVLNLNDVQKVANYEKKVSKKPAIFLFILGILLIAGGFAYPYIMEMIGGETSNNTPNSNEETQTDENQSEVQTQTGSLICNYAQAGNADGTDMTISLQLNFVEDQLNNYVKTIVVSPTVGQEAIGNATIQNLYASLQPYQAAQIPGYVLAVTSNEIELQETLTIDFTTLDKTQIPTDYNTTYTMVDFDANESMQSVRTKVEANGYQCQ